MLDRIKNLFEFKTLSKHYKLEIETLHPGYHDDCMIFVEACVQILNNFVLLDCSAFYKACLNDEEVVKLNDKTNEDIGLMYLEEKHERYEGISDMEIESLDEQEVIHAEIVSLYKWWNYERLKQIEFIDSLYNKLPSQEPEEFHGMVSGKIKKNKIYRKRMGLYNKINAREDVLRKDEDEMLMRLVKISRHFAT